MQPLLLKLADLSRRARWLALGHAIGTATFWVVVALLLLAGIDFIFKSHDYGVRAIFSLIFWGTVGWASYRYVWPTITQRFSEVGLAQRVEQTWPHLTDRISSAVEFLRQDDGDRLAGSPALRRAVITAATAEIEPLDFNQVLNRQPTRRAVTAALVALAILAVCGLVYPAFIHVGVPRLLMPWSSATWPRWHNLQIVGEPPQRLAVGQTFELNVTDRDGRLPDDAELQMRYDVVESQGGEEVRKLPMQRLNDLFIARQENVSRSFAYRVVGGDDFSMPWRQLEVIEPPQVESVKISLQPPAYTGWPAVPAERHIQALRGTQVALTADVSKKLRNAQIVRTSGEPVPGRISDDGHTVVIPGDAAQPFVIDESTEYWLEMTDEEGLVGGQQDRWEIRAVTDTAPTVAIEQPTSNLFVTAQAEVPLRLLIKDDIAIAGVELRVSRSEDAETGDLVIPLRSGPKAAPKQPKHAAAIPRDGEMMTIDHAWQLAPLSLKPGAQLTVVAVASDYLPQSATSPQRKITIITAAELEERLDGRQSLILAELNRALKLQQETRAQTQDVAVQLERTNKLAKQDVDHAQASQLNQRVVAELLTGTDRGLPSHIADLLAELAANQVDSPDMQRRLTALHDELASLDREHLTPVERQLTDAIKRATTALNNSTDDTQEIKKPLAAALGHQDQVIATLEQLLADFSQWDNYRRFAREISSLKQEQLNLAEQTAQISAKTVGKSAQALSSQEKADLGKLAARQQDLARQFEKARQQMADMARDLADTDPLASATLTDAVAEALRRGTSGRMRSTAGQLENNQVNQARQTQAQTSQDLDELLNILANRREQELARLVAGLREAESQLAQLRRQQTDVRQQLQRLGKEPDSPERRRQLERLTRQQRELERETARLSRRLQRLQADRASRSSQSAAGKMSAAGTAGDQQNADAAADEAAQAEKDLEEAQAQLAQRRQQAENDLAAEQVGKLQDALANLQNQQQTLHQETVRLDQLRQQQGQLSRAQLLTLRDLTRNQRSLADETSGMAENLAQAEVFRLALDIIVGEMQAAAAQLDLRHVDELAQRPQLAALERLAQLVEAFRSARQQGGEQGPAGGEGGGQMGGDPSQIRALAEVKLLKLMQQHLNERFTQLIARREQLSADAVAKQLTALSEEQEKLAAMLQNFASEQNAAPAADDPSRLPELDLEESLTP